jgi:hypothetical protein
MKRGIFLILACLLCAGSAHALGYSDRIQLGASAGIGFPQIPMSRFRTPVSILGTATFRLIPAGKTRVRMDASALTSFKTGTVNGQNGTMKYDMRYATLCAGREFRKQHDASTVVFLGLGMYRIDKQIDRTVEKYDTRGLNAGAEFLNLRRSARTFFDLNWHLLFKPGSNPQILTMTFGILF